MVMVAKARRAKVMGGGVDPRDEAWSIRGTQPPLPDWVKEIHDYQAEVVEQVVKEYARGARVVFLDAPTGSGKSLIGELVRRRLEVEQGLYVCSTKSLQAQYVRDFGYARVLKGRMNYIPTKMSGKAERDWARGSARGRGGVDFITCADCDAGPPGMPAEEQTCSYCEFVEECPYTRARSEALQAPVGVLNTSYLLAECNGPGKFKGRDLVVADEADLLEGELLGFVELRVPKRVLEKLSLEVPKKGSHMTTIRRWLEDEVLEGLKAERRRLRGVGGLEGRREFNRVDRLVGDVERVITREDGWVRDGDEEGRDNGLVLKPVSVEDVAERYLWRHGGRWLCMTGTLVSAEMEAESLGLEHAGVEWAQVSAPMLFAKENRRVVFVPVASMTRKGQEAGGVAKVLRGVEKVLEKHPGVNVLIHTHTYKLAEEVARHVKGWGKEAEVEDGRPVLTYTSARDRDAALERFRDAAREGGAILVASSMDRGVDLPGDLCLAAGTRVLTERLAWVPIEKVAVGDRIIGIDEEPDQAYAYRALRYAEVEATASRWAECYKITTTHGSITATAEHPFLTKRANKRNVATWTEVCDLKEGDRLRWIASPVEQNMTWAAGYLAGFFDGEGCVSMYRRTNSRYQAFNITGAQRPGEVMDTVTRLLDELGFKHAEHLGSNEVMHTTIQGRMSDRLRFLSTIRPERLITNTNLDSMNGRDQFAATILSIEPVGNRQVFNLQTSTHTFIAEGFATHNCRVQIIAKVPMASLGSRQVSERLRGKGGELWYLVGTVRTLLQMCGRAVRGRDDWAVTYVLDEHFGKVLKDGKKMGLWPQWWLDALEVGKVREYV